MADPRITGTTAPVKQPLQVSFDPQRGQVIREAWESAGDNLRGVAGAYESTKTAYDGTFSPAKSTLVATTSGAVTGQDEVTVDTWQILANEIQKDLREHPKSIALGATALEKITKYFNENKNLSDFSPALTGDAETLYKLLRSGTTHYALGQYVLRHTTNVSNQYNKNVADINVNKLYTTTQLLTECQDGTLWTYTLPGRLAYKIENIAAPASATGYLWSWRKLPSTETTTSGNRIEINTEYWLEQWSTFIYDAAVLE